MPIMEFLLSNPSSGRASRTRRRGVSSPFIVVIVAVLLGAGFLFHQILMPTGEQAAVEAEARTPIPQNRPKPKPAEPQPEADEFRSRIAIFHVGEGDAKRQVVALDMPRGPQRVEQLTGSDQSLIGRDLFRQALLIAARDEMGLATRDELLDDLTPPQGEVAGIEVASVIKSGGGLAIVRRLDEKGNAIESLLRRNLSAFKDDAEMLPSIVPDAEALSRSEFPGVLKTLGLAGEPNKIRPDAAVADDIEERLTHLGFTENLSAIRDLHAAIRADGESPARLSGLARGYAQLGVLSEFHWHPAHKAFKARALLYAQRMVARAPKSPFALRSRAFVRAVIGIPWRAIEDLDEAARIVEATKSSEEPPAWLNLINAHARSDLKSYRKIEGRYSRLASLLRMFALEYPSGSLANQAAYHVLKADPDCFRAYDLLSENQGVSVLHMSTATGPGQLLYTLPSKLKSLKGLPSGVQAPLDRLEKILATYRKASPDANEDVAKDGEAMDLDWVKAEAEVIEALGSPVAPGDANAEPGWGVLAHLLRETNFIQIWRRLNFMMTTWSVPVGDYWASIKPLVAHHRYLPFLELKADPSPQSEAAFAEYFKRADVSAFELGQIPLVNEVVRYSKTNGHSIWSIVYFHGDTTNRELTHGTWAGNKKQALHYANTQLRLDPHSAQAMSRLIELDWDGSKDKVNAWRRTTDESPVLLKALALKYTEMGKYEQARPILEEYIRESPEPWAYEKLADNFKALGKMEDYRAALKKCLEESTDERGLDHARVQVKLAKDLMKQKKWNEARPYAEAAAQTWAGWAMLCAASCAEAMEDWEAAETWYRRTSERYPTNNRATWYEFCKRTSHGNLAAAKKWAEGSETVPQEIP